MYIGFRVLKTGDRSYKLALHLLEFDTPLESVRSFPGYLLGLGFRV